MASDSGSNNRRVLVIDDNASIHADFRKILAADTVAESGPSAAERALFGTASDAPARPTFEVDFASQGRDGLERVEQALRMSRPYAVAFVDMRMPPGWDGLETIEHLWSADPNLQVVICSAHSDYDWVEVVSRLGHAEKLLIVKKPFETIEILQCASALTHKWRNEKELRQQAEMLEQMLAARTQGLEAANRQLRHLASHDPLTGLPNRVLLEDRLAHAIAHAKRDGKEFGLIVIDLDRFKLVNDSFGHGAGDDLLKQVAHRLSAVVRNVDTVARLGGDEFVVIVSPVCGREDVTAVAQRIMQELRVPVKTAGVDMHVTPSIGIAFYPSDGSSCESLVAHADSAMYYAKQRGRNNFQCYAPNMNTVSRDTVRLESDLHKALALDQFELHYQPKVDTATGMVHSAEALIRWHHPDQGEISPADFIPIAEECGLIGAIGEWVIHEACRQARAWQQAGLQALRVAVNLSATQFRQGNLLAVIESALTDAQLEPRYLEVELTESAVMTDPEESIRILEQLSRMGVLVSVDDFGTGYSSMSYLRRFPIDKLKIDRGFVADMSASADDASIVRAIVSLAHSLRLKVVAEGVETREQLDFLRSLGCDQYQGYHFSRALPAGEFEALLRQANAVPPAEDDTGRTHSKLAAYRFIS